ncbi:hypothetical protein D3C86_2147590 [compost metagenome]
MLHLPPRTLGFRRIRNPQLQGRSSNRHFQLIHGAFRYHMPAVNNGNPVGQLIGFVQILRG